MLKKTACVIIILLCSLMTACATQQYYASTVNTWQGQNAKQLFRIWGYPDREMKLPHGHVLYVYRVHQVQDVPAMRIPGQTDVYTAGGQTYVTTTHDVVEGGEHVVSNCTTWFETDSTGKIVGVEFRGNACEAGDKFKQQYSAP